jgi:hypothetical protein
MQDAERRVRDDAVRVELGCRPGGARAGVVADEHRALLAERVHEAEDVIHQLLFCIA